MKEEKDTKDRLMRVERTINIYFKGSNELLSEINIDSIPFYELITIVVPQKDDPLLYDGYILNEQQLSKLFKHLNIKTIHNCILYDYILVCGGIYDWSK